jgi:hypothetical protein
MAACFGLWEHLCHDGEVMRDVERRSSKLLDDVADCRQHLDLRRDIRGGRDAIRAWAEETGASELAQAMQNPITPLAVCRAQLTFSQ